MLRQGVGYLICRLEEQGIKTIPHTHLIPGTGAQNRRTGLKGVDGST